MPLKTTILLLLTFLLLSPVPAKASEHKPRIILLHSYHQGYKWTDDITRGVLSILKDRADLRIEYMDTKRYMGEGGISQDRYLNLLNQILKVKHTQSPYDLIITADNYAFDFFRLFARRFFPKIPIVFCGINNLDHSIPSLDPNMTGVNEKADITASIELIRELFPDRRNLICIVEYSVSGKILYKELKQVTEEFAGRFDSIRILHDISMTEMERELSLLDQHSVVFHTFFTRDNRGSFFEYDEAINRICEAAGEVPVMGAWDFNMGEGIVGGLLVSGFEQGRMAAELALKALAEGSARKVEIIRKSPLVSAYDFEILEKHGISLNRIPGGSVLINQPESVFYTYKEELLALLLFIITLLFLIILLKRGNVRLKSAQHLLKKERDLLDKRVDERTRSLRIAQDQLILHERQAAIGSLLAGMAHEINTPLGIAITGSSHLTRKIQLIQKELDEETLSREDLETGLDEFLEGMNLTLGSLERAAALVDNFKTLTSSENLQNPIEFNLKEYVGDLIEAYERSFSESNIRIILSGEDTILKSKKDYFYGIMTNILMNSRDHAFPPGMVEENIIHIHICSDRADSSLARIEYEDSGVGIPAEMLEVLFEPFTTTGRSSGKIGLGLHKVYKLVTEKLKGTIECPVEPLKSSGRGVHFLIRFPKVLDSDEILT